MERSLDLVWRGISFYEIWVNLRERIDSVTVFLVLILELVVLRAS